MTSLALCRRQCLWLQIREGLWNSSLNLDLWNVDWKLCRKGFCCKITLQIFKMSHMTEWSVEDYPNQSKVKIPFIPLETDQNCSQRLPEIMPKNGNYRSLVGVHLLHTRMFDTLQFMLEFHGRRFVNHEHVMISNFEEHYYKYKETFISVAILWSRYICRAKKSPWWVARSFGEWKCPSKANTNSWLALFAWPVIWYVSTSLQSPRLLFLFVLSCWLNTKSSWH